MSVPFMVSVVPGVNKVKLGETATFECLVGREVQVDTYEWVGSEKIAKEERFSYDQMKKFLHVADVKTYDNNTWVDCTATDTGGRVATASGRISVLMGDGMSHNDSMGGTLSNEIPPITAGGGVLIAFLFIVIIGLMFAALWWLKRMEMQKQEEVESSRSRYSRIESGPASPRACFTRDNENIMFSQHGHNEEDGENDDCYEDMLPVVPKRMTEQAPRSGSPGNSRYPSPRH